MYLSYELKSLLIRHDIYFQAAIPEILGLTPTIILDLFDIYGRGFWIGYAAPNAYHTSIVR